MLKSAFVAPIVLLAVLGLVAGCDGESQPQKSATQQDASRTQESDSADEAADDSLKEGLAAVAEDLVIAASTSARDPEPGQPVARIALDQVTVGMMPVYPITHPSKRERGFELRNRQLAAREVETREFAREQLASADGAWSAEIDGVVDDFVAFLEKQGESTAGVRMTVAVDRTTPAVELSHLLEAAREAGVDRFDLLARRVETLDEGLSTDAALANIDVRWSPDIDGSLSSKPLAIVVTPQGFDLYWKGWHVEVIDGCEPSGPTVCLADAGVDAAAELKRARDALRRGEFEASETYVRKALARYDWAGLSEELAGWREVLPSKPRLYIVSREDVSVAAAFRVIEVVQFGGESLEPFFERATLTLADPAKPESARSRYEALTGLSADEVREISVEQLRLYKKLNEEMLRKGPLKDVFFNEDGTRKQK